MRIVLLSLLSITFAAACQYSPSLTGAPLSANSTESAAPDTPNASAPHGDIYYQTYIGRYDLARDH
jgi:hypothetical protein